MSDPLASDLLASDLLGSVPRAPLICETLSEADQRSLVDVVRDIIRSAPLFTPVMPRTGKPFYVRMTNCGPLGWVSDVAGYRYQATHPETGAAWPAIPDLLLDLWSRHARYPHPPEACLINWYDASAKMGLHQDRDEVDFAAPVLSVSLGAPCLFRIGGRVRADRTRSFRLGSGDVMMLSGPDRLAFHGVDRIEPGASPLLGRPGRINLTLRRVTAPL